jgi:hypothetical protein
VSVYPSLSTKPAEQPIPTYAEGHFRLARPLSESRHKDSARAISGSPVARACACSVIRALGCSALGGEPVSVTTPNGQVATTAVPASPEPSALSTGKPPPNELKKGRDTRTLKAGNVRVNVKHSLRTSIRYEIVSSDGLQMSPNP